jgi:hypothetical protein
MKTNPSFIGTEIHHDLLFDLSANAYPSVVHGFKGVEFHLLSETSNTYGYVQNGISSLTYNGQTYPVTKGMYFSVPGKFKISGGEGILIEYLNHQGLFQIGGAIEAEGRLKYIDGCTDSLIIPPIMRGNPCLNHLHFPPHIVQSPHTHPSYRIGIVAKGNGLCVTPFGDLALTEGIVFVIKEFNRGKSNVGLDGEIYKDGTHSFNTEDDSMDVIAFHPESKFGPTNTKHPMISRTYVNGISAEHITNIHTK